MLLQTVNLLLTSVPTVVGVAGYAHSVKSKTPSLSSSISTISETPSLSVSVQKFNVLLLAYWVYVEV
ncbi:hypothetical protein D3C87_1752500 [compost metagenome]